MDNNAFREIEDGEKMKKNIVRTLITMLVLTMAMTLSTYAAAVYSYTISGIRRYGKGKYGTISGTFTA